VPCIEVSGASLYYEVNGSGPPLVLVHGGGCTHRDWHGLVAALSGDLTVLTLDLRCHGQSSGSLAECTVERWASDVNALIEALNLAPAVLVGHSLASRIVVEAASQKPPNAAGLILLDGSRSMGGPAATEPTVPEALHSSPSLATIAVVLAGPYADSKVRQHVLAALSAHSMELLTACVAVYDAWDAECADTVFAVLPPALPMLAVQSTYHDKFTPRRYLTSKTQSTPYLDFLRTARPSIQIEILPDTGHFSMLERPADISALIRAFAASLRNQP
jgi:pimeloyl-ACP methyl ester carboxylesterase